MMGNEMMVGRKDDGGAVPALEVFGSVGRTRGVPAGEGIAPHGSGLPSDSGACGLFDPSLAARPVVLFDFDGTLANTQPAIMRVVSEVLARRCLLYTSDAADE